MSSQQATQFEFRAPAVFTVLDAARQTEHWFLEPGDVCVYLTQYFCTGTDSGSRAARFTRLIRDFKCRPTLARSETRRGRHKQRAIATLAEWLRGAMTREAAECCTWVPIPPSRRFGDPDFDDRLMRTLALAFIDYDVDVRTLLYQQRSLSPDHMASARVSAATLFGNLRLDFETLAGRPLRDRIVLFDDVLTSGKHYRCCERRLRATLPSWPIGGVFLMRRALRNSSAAGGELADQASAASTASPASCVDAARCEGAAISAVRTPSPMAR